MAKERKVTRGFGFYLFMFILLLVAAFMVIVCIMMFSPGKVILGYQYFNNNQELVLSTTNDESKQPFNFSTNNKFVIDANTSKISIVKADVEKEEIIFVNKSMGFAKWNDRINAEFSVTQKEGVINVQAKEPHGFLHFSYDLQVIVRVPYDKYDFSKTAFEINTTEGSVIVGNPSQVEKENDILKPKSLRISTQSGNINITHRLGNQYTEVVDGKEVKLQECEFTDLKLSTTSGTIRTGLDRIKASLLMSMETKSGAIDVKTLQAVNGCFINLGDGHLQAKKVNGDVSLITHNGRIDIEEIQGSFDTNTSIDVIDAANINIGSVSGEVSLPNIKASNVNIKSIGSQVNIQTTSGNVTLGSESVGIYDSSYIKTQSGTINVSIKDKSTLKVNHYFITENGNINVKYLNDILSNNIITTSNGNVNASVGSKYKFTLHCKDFEGKYKDYDNLTLTFISKDQYKKEALNVNGYDGSTNILDISTNGHITVDLLKIA